MRDSQASLSNQLKQLHEGTLQIIIGYPIYKGQIEAGIQDSFVKGKRLKAGLDDCGLSRVTL